MRRFLLCVLLFCILFLTSQKGYSTSITATQNGNWNSTATWGDMGPPGCFDTIVIPAGITVTITVTVNLTSCPPVYILVEGTLTFQSGKKLDLPLGSIVYIPPGGQLNGGGGGGSSNWITIGGSTYWSAGDGNVSGAAIFCAGCALPIELIYFEAELLNGYVNITWQTASETENDYFLIERSSDGLNWETVQEVDGANNSSSLISYGIEDRNVLLGISYYRLKQVDNNGAFSISDIRVISNGQFSTNQDLLVLSSQCGGQHNVTVYFSEPVSGPVDVFVTSINGSVIFSQTFQLEDQKWIVVVIDQALSSGVYIVKANQFSQKVFLQ